MRICRSTVGLNKSDYNFCKFVGQFQIGKMAGVVEDDSARTANAGFDGSGVSMHVGDIGIAGDDQGWKFNFVQARKRALRWSSVIVVGQILRIVRQKLQ